VQTKFKNSIKDDPVKESNKRGYVTFAQTSAPNSRSTQIFVNYKDNSFLDSQRFAPFGQVTSGMEAVDKISSEYGEKPNQGSIQSQGNVYLKAQFPKLDYVKKATIEK
jgi:peptidyl-prolyl cis-trans isomerase A (cyclophilin A)